MNEPRPYNIGFSANPALRTAIDIAAGHESLSRASWMRRVIVKQLQASGMINPNFRAKIRPE